ncbi:MAG TPA: Gfo/Idh/MocA family oxidoreductase [Phototrophicaceae bacterium]|nr:Gfo/Idh/MocA family oxidoreductase [Phototrophicaceae bacterium]
MVVEQKLRGGVIGLGVGKAHAKGYLSSPDVELIAVCDSNEDRLQTLAAEWDVPVRYTDYKKMLAETPLDMVSICLPNALHAEAALLALEAGLHVICEKPMAPTVAEARHMLEMAQRCNRRLMIAYNFRYRPDTRWMKNLVQSGALGTIYQANVSWRRETGIPGSGWFGEKDLAGGGALIDLGVHVIDLALWLMGFPEVKTVSGETRRLFGQRNLKTWGRHPGDVARDNFDVDDGSVGFIRLANGAHMLVQATWAEHTQPQQDDIRVELQGTEGTVVLHIRNYKNEDTLRFYTEIHGEPVTVIPSVRFGAPQGHEALIHDLAHCLQHDLPVGTDGTQGLAAIRILEGLYESAKTGREVVFANEQEE